MRLARGDHREAVGEIGDAAIKNDRLLDVDHFLDGGIELTRLFAAQADGTVGLGQLDEIRHRFRIGIGQAVAVQQLLPLTNHAHVLVVQDEDLDRRVVLDSRRHFLNAHLDRGIAGNVDDQAFRMGDLHAKCCRQAIAHGPEAARGHPAVRLFETEELCRPHLVLADFRRDVGVAMLRQLVEPLDSILRHDDIVARLVGEGIARTPAGDIPPPVAKPIRRRLLRQRPPQANHVFQNIADIAEDADIDVNVLVDGRWVDIDVDFLRIRREGIEAAGDAVVKARADTDHDVAIMHRHVGFVGTMHAQHAEPVLARCRISAETHQRRGDREACQLDEFAQQLGSFRTGVDDTAAGIDDRLACILHQFDRLGDLVEITLNLWLIALLGVMRFRRRIGAGGKLNVLRNVDHNRTRAAGLRDAEGFMNNGGQLVDVLDQPVVLGARPRDADRIAFLESVRADQRRRNLARQADERDRVHQGILQRRDGIGRARTGGDQHDADLAGGAGIAFGRMAGALLVADENVLDVVLLEDLVIDRKHRAARITENVFDAVVLERLQHDLRACHSIAARLIICAGHTFVPLSAGGLER
ncbi:hypothetical protein RHSP_45851 [Rhizobium freirei PRF 81]|uniref:Uncharacterized protein n=1 Tax=Rhizobium freirei PRF 81 TaxID=363754 RepID=N6V3L4_9HYPH|nr:hypothetical protein RHSP_45851 [Rhizobium freirei PRF 81]